MSIPLYQVDAFTSALFQGNPAAVCLLTDWLPDHTLLSIAAENNLAETAFCKKNENSYDLRWFTPEIEMDLCGHATLATAHVLMHERSVKTSEIKFNTASGVLSVKRHKGRYEMDFPARPAVRAVLPDLIRRAINRQPDTVYKARDYVLVYPSEDDIISFDINQDVVDGLNLDPGGIVITAPGNDVDFVSRFFTPQAAIFEDPVTGSAHCTLIPYWADVLQKDILSARQLSARGGELYCENKVDRVLVGGHAITYSKSHLVDFD